MEALILVGHGSRRPDANDEIVRLAERLAAEGGGRFALVRPAFLEFVSPTVGEAVAECAAAGAGSVRLLPYFLAAGRHVTADLPALVAQARQAHPQVDLRLLPHLGAADGLAPLLMAVASEP